MHTIRRAQERDIPGILRLLLQVNMVHHNGRPDLFKGPATKYSEAQLRDILLDAQTPVFVSVDEAGAVEGHAFCIHRQARNDSILTDIKTLYIDDICVDETLRHSGVGQALYAHVRDYAAACGCYNLTLNVWSCNPGALRFYEKCGMVPQKIGMEALLQGGA